MGTRRKPVADGVVEHGDVRVETKIMEDGGINLTLPGRKGQSLSVSRIHSGDSGTGVGLVWVPTASADD